MSLKTPKTRAYESIGPSPVLPGQSSDFEMFLCDIDKLAAPKRRRLGGNQPQNQSQSMKPSLDNRAAECQDALSLKLAQIVEEEELKVSDDEEEEIKPVNAVCKEYDELRVSDYAESDEELRVSDSSGSAQDEELRVSDSEDDVS